MILQTEVAESSEGEGTEAAGGFRAMRRQLAAKASAAARPEDAARVQQLLAEYNQLDYEDIVAGIPTRFSYREVCVQIAHLGSTNWTVLFIIQFANG